MNVFCVEVYDGNVIIVLFLFVNGKLVNLIRFKYFKMIMVGSILDRIRRIIFLGLFS